MKKIKFVNILMVLAFTTTLWSQQTEKQLSLSDCIVGALKNNLGLAVEVFNPPIGRYICNAGERKICAESHFRV